MGLAVPMTPKTTKEGEHERFDYAVSAMQGHGANMEDAHAIVLNLDATTGISFFGVYDGKGGPAVSKYCARRLHNELCRDKRFRDNLQIAIERTFLRMDERLKGRKAGRELSGYGGSDRWKAYRKARRIIQKPAYEGPQSYGCTACVILIRGNQITVGKAGDSRCVLSRDNLAIDLSSDFKPNLEAKRQRIEAAGKTTTFNERRNVHRIDDGILVSRSLGDLMYKDNNALGPQQQAITAFPEVRTVEITQEDQFLIIASDGIWDCVTSQQAVDFIRIYLNAGVNLRFICEALLNHCLAQPRGKKNMTVVLVRFKTPQDIYQAATGGAPQSAGAQFPDPYGDQPVVLVVDQAEAPANTVDQAEAPANTEIKVDQTEVPANPGIILDQAEAPANQVIDVDQAEAPPNPKINTLCDSLLAEILVRLPAHDPIPLIQAALVCQQWRNIIADPYFRRRFREVHTEVPILGLLCNMSWAGGGFCQYISKASFIPKRVQFDGWRVIGSRHGIVLLYPLIHQFVLKVWKPITGEEVHIPPPERHPMSWSAALLCDKNCKCYCPNGQFHILLVGTDRDGMFSSVFSSTKNVWSIPTPTYLTNTLVTVPPAHLGESLFFLLRDSDILRFNISEKDVSVIPRPPDANFQGRPLLIKWEANLGFATVDEDIVTLHTLDISSDSSLWVIERMTDLGTLMPSTSLMTLPFLVGFSPEMGVIYVWTAISGLFQLDLKSEIATRGDLGPHQIRAVIPHFGYYLPGIDVVKNALTDGANAMYDIVVHLLADYNSDSE